MTRYNTVYTVTWFYGSGPTLKANMKKYGDIENALNKVELEALSPTVKKVILSKDEKPEEHL